MDERCPRGLESFPTEICPEAVKRLKAIRNGQGDIQNLKIGCDWYIQDKASHYCFFKYMADNDGESRDTIEIASLLSATQASVYSSLAKAIEKVKEAGIGEMLLGEDE